MQLLPAASEAQARARTEELAAVNDTIDPDTVGPVIQMIAEGRFISDFRTGLAVPALASPEEFRALLLSTLPLPVELREVLS
jgi:hypothetical protein